MSTEAPARVRALPIVLQGRRMARSPAGEHRHVFPNGSAVSLPRLGPDDVDALLAQDRHLLTDIPLQDILAFLNRAGKAWRSDEFGRRRIYVRQLQDLLGYSAPAAAAEADRIAIVLNSHSRMYDLVEAELGSRFVVDTWVPREEAWVRALPRGLVLHVLPGNVPLATALSLVRALVTKNVSIAKMGSTDPVTATALAQTFIELDPDHPVTRSTSVVYWDHESVEGRRLVGDADAVVAWGGNEAMKYARRHSRDDALVTCFGPKQSFALVDANGDPRRAARGLAHDVAIYDQGACFSIRRAFVTGPADLFVAELWRALDAYADLLPVGVLGPDRAAHVQLSRRTELFLDRDVTFSRALDWTVVVCDPDEVPTEHPLGRVLYVHPVASLSESYRFANPTIQTVAASPWSLLGQHRDELARRGVSRFVELGLVHLFRIGGTHDGVNSLQGTVRMVSAEAPGDVFGKGMVLPLDETAMLEAGTLKDLVL